MKRIVPIGFALLGLINATMPADAAHRQARRPGAAPIPQQRYVAPLPSQWAGNGVRIEEVIPNTGAARAGIRPGDVLVGINGRTINGYPDLDAAVAASGGRALTLDVYRGGSRIRLRALPTFAITPNGYGSIEQRRVLGVAHTESRWVLMPCALDPDCE